MENGKYAIGTKVKFVGNDGEPTSAGCHPRVGAIGVLDHYFGSDNTGAFFKWPAGAVRSAIYDDITFVSYCFLELAENETEKENDKMETESMIICAHCGCIIEDPDDAYEVRGGKKVCEDCLNSWYTECYECGEYVKNSEIYSVDGREVCLDCLEYNDDIYFRCDDCGEWYRRTCWNEPIETHYGETICQDCYEDHYGTCEECGEVYHTNDLYAIHGDWVCENCRTSRRIHDYGYKPQPVFKAGNSIHDVFYSKNEVKDLLFGVELEIDHGDDPEEVAYDLTEASEDVYCKHDGSLDEGVEIVSHPCTLDYHKNYLGWKELCSIALDHDFESHTARTCGLHVHVGRWQFGENQQQRDEVAAKLVILVNRHWENVVKFSRRKREQLDEWARKPDFREGENAEECLENALRSRDSGRYQAVNLQNRETVEFRVFNGSLKYQTIYATLEFISNLVRYAMTHTVEEVMASQWDDIINVELYDELTEYLQERNIVAEKIEAMQFRKTWKPQDGDWVKVVNYCNWDENLRYVQGETFQMLNTYNKNEVLLLVGERWWAHNASGMFNKPYGYFAKKDNLEFLRHADESEMTTLGKTLYELEKRPDPVTTADTGNVRVCFVDHGFEDLEF